MRKRERERKRERISSVVGNSEGLRDLREMLFDTGNRSVVVVTKSRKTGPLRPHREWRSCDERKSDFFNKSEVFITCYIRSQA